VDAPRPARRPAALLGQALARRVRERQDVYIPFNANGRHPGAPYAVYSHNGGGTWSPPILAPANRKYWFASGVAVTPDGTVFSAQTAYPQDYDGHIIVWLLRSRDGGRSWERIGIDRSREQPQCPRGSGCAGFAYFGSQMAIASDADGRVYLLYNANKRNQAPNKLLFRYSDYGGETWTLSRNVARNGAGVDHEFPMRNTWHKRSTDGGVTGRARPASQTPRAARPTSPRGFEFPYGDYGQLAIDSEGSSQATWGEGPSYTGPGGFLVRARHLAAGGVCINPEAGAIVSTHTS
jgi:hypothetical protein